LLTTGILKGTTKRKELHGTTKVLSMSGFWASDRSVTKLQGYKLNFICDQVGQKYSDFVLLIDANIAKEAATLDIDLYLHDKMVKASVSPCGPLELDAQQVWSSPYISFIYLASDQNYLKDSFPFSLRWNKQN
jgi:endoribonuclease Dicer